jgi:hypothetical protein
MTFEAALDDAFERYLADAPVDVDAVALAAHAAHARGRRRFGLVDRLAGVGAEFGPARRTLVVATIALLLLAVFATLLIVGSLVTQPRPGGDHLLFSNGSYECQNLIRFVVRTAASSSVVECSNRLKVDPGGTRAAARGPDGIEIVDLRDGSSTKLASSAGALSTPAAWSPGGNWLHWIDCEPYAGPLPSIVAPEAVCHGFIGRPGTTTANEIPEAPGSGYNGSFVWSAQDTAFYLQTDAGALVGAGDGSGLGESIVGMPLAISPDGRTAAATDGRHAGGGEGIQSDLYLEGAAGGARTRLTENEDGWFVACPVWSPEGDRIAFILQHRGTVAAPEAEPTSDLLVARLDGSVVQRWPLPGAVNVDCSAFLGRNGGMTWAPDGARLLITQSSRDENPPPGPFVLTVATGDVVPLTDLERFAFSADGSSLAALAGVDHANPDAIEAAGTLEVLDLKAGTTRSLGPVTVGQWTVLTWTP